jgi:hypothetical protein
MVNETTDWYLKEMQMGPAFEAKELQNRYAFYQKQNPHTPRTMKSLGLNDKDVDFFVDKCLFPEIQ